MGTFDNRSHINVAIHPQPLQFLHAALEPLDKPCSRSTCSKRASERRPDTDLLKENHQPQAEPQNGQLWHDHSPQVARTYETFSSEAMQTGSFNQQIGQNRPNPSTIDRDASQRCESEE